MLIDPPPDPLAASSAANCFLPEAVLRLSERDMDMGTKMTLDPLVLAMACKLSNCRICMAAGLKEEEH